jgi:GNAT superfamily N-acetyltransferase
MSLEWIPENPPRWDESKAMIIGGAPAGVFELGSFQAGELIPGEWWRVEQDGSVVGYGWMDCTWGDAEILLAVDPGSRNRGVGTFILDHLEEEAAVQGLNYLLNEVRPAHPDKDGITRWLGRRRFAQSADGRLMRRVVHPHESH